MGLSSYKVELHCPVSLDPEGTAQSGPAAWGADVGAGGGNNVR